MGTLGDFLDYLYKTSPLFTPSKADEVVLVAERFLRSIRELTGGHYPAGTPLVHIRCGHCGKHVATMEQDADGGVMTYWPRLRRRFPGLPKLECPATQRQLDITAIMIMEKVRTAHATDTPQTLRASIRRVR